MLLGSIAILACAPSEADDGPSPPLPGSITAASDGDEGLGLGQPCDDVSPCALELHCVDGVCCESACGGGDPGDCEACSIAAGGSADGLCTALRADIAPAVTCREAVGPCDLPEVCEADSRACPDDAFADADVVCRPADGDCDLPETCTGDAPDCPDDAFADADVVCRPAVGDCDLPETCTGDAPDCPDDAFADADVVCRPAVGDCDLPETCAGDAPDCPDDAFADAGVVCRPSAGACDVPETCTGDAADCPPDLYAGPALVCRPPAGLCDVAESCTGASPECPPDAFQPPTLVCRPAADDCDLPESCTGDDALCPPDELAAAGTVCREADGDCDVPETCTGASAVCPEDAYADPGTVCREAAGTCDVAETCDGASPLCPEDAYAEADTVCREAAGECDVAEKCSGASPFCPVDGFAPSTQACRDPYCGDGVQTRAANCTGFEPRCPEPVTDPCAPYLCGEVACLSDCESPLGCVPGHTCDGGGQCVLLGEPGDGCTDPSACATGYCVDGLCCDESCTGQCEACDTGEAPGSCVAIEGHPRGGRAPCSGDQAPCAGACDGDIRDACAYPGAAVACREAGCDDGLAVLPAACDGAGRCPAETTVDCEGFACVGVDCGDECGDDEDCVDTAYCAAGLCLPRRERGAACDAPSQCATGLCVDGLCCDLPCAGQCEACDRPGAEGSCVAVEGDPRGNRPACASDGSACAGVCDGVVRSACRYATTPCGEAVCDAGVATSATCDGQGACVSDAPIACYPFACGDVRCLDQCAADRDCALGLSCIAGGCAVAEVVLTSGGGCQSGPLQPGPLALLAALVWALRRRARHATRPGAPG